MEIKTVSILGCGWFGLAFAKALLERSYGVKGSTTSADKLEKLSAEGIKPYLINLNEEEYLPSDFFNADVLFISVPPRAKAESSSQYPDKIKKVIAAAKQQVQQVVFVSSTGVFEDGNFAVDENTRPHPQTDAGRAILATEDLLRRHENFSTTIVRFAGLIGKNRNLARHFAGKRDIPNGLAPINLIELQDCIGICLKIIETQNFGKIYHAVTPHHPNRAEFYESLCLRSGMEEAKFKRELLPWKQVNSSNVPQTLNYDFKVKNWFQWMENLSF
ncbi:NAD(P)H-binding protein [Pedobacter sp. ASV28]|uniref:NAD(P)H-binding protein n=1 Tax=Pedobacter sp. ASV28 TaxID=2795123 RepID=UPI0018EDDC55|nr:NAD(P)H-binding protein [Pedobacter sp. ASV28]